MGPWGVRPREAVEADAWLPGSRDLSYFPEGRLCWAVCSLRWLIVSILKTILSSEEVCVLSRVLTRVEVWKCTSQNPDLGAPGRVLGPLLPEPRPRTVGCRK